MLTADVRTITGDDNNLAHPDWGSAGEQLLRFSPAAYDDGISTPALADRLSAREISNILAAQVEETILNDRHLSAMVYAFGQFLDHDIDLTDAAVPAEPLPIPVPAGDPYFDPAGTGTQTIAFSRSAYDPATGTSLDNPRQQLNRITAFIDGSQIYGSDDARALALRTGEGGRLKTSDGDLLPFNTEGLRNDNPTGLPPETLFVAGDVRANENIELTSLHTLFVREHNRLADRLAGIHPDWSDEQTYQQARRLVIGELQAIAYHEFLPALLGEYALARYRGYNPNVNPGIATELSTAALRLGHSMLGNDVEFLDNFAEEVHEEIPLREAFFNPGLLGETGIDSILKYLASDPSQEIDNTVTNEVRNFLFGEPGAGGFDLASLNIQRGRDHGLASYNDARAAYGLHPAESFADITRNEELQQALAEAFGDVDNVELWAGGLAEGHVRGGSVGPLFRAILVDQFERLRAGDRFWYERDLSGFDLRFVRETTLADVISRNTTISNLQDNVFLFFNSIEGRVFFDADGDGRFDRRERGLGGIRVELLDADGNLIASAISRRDGSYAFEDLELGVYYVRISLPRGFWPTTPRRYQIDLTRAEEFSSVNFGVAFRSHDHRAAEDRFAANADDPVSTEVDPDALLEPLDFDV
ncbi:MAG: peroxidase family protein [Pirellulales bacterium]